MVQTIASILRNVCDTPTPYGYYSKRGWGVISDSLWYDTFTISDCFNVLCKISIVLGYDLGIDERRKAVNYVNDLNDSDELTSFTHLDELTGHIFISNHFKYTQKENIKEYFEKYVVDDKRSKPILITTDTLMYLHAKYREHFEEIEYKKTYFYECLYNVLVNDTNIVTNNDIDVLISDVLNRRWQDEYCIWFVPTLRFFVPVIAENFTTLCGTIYHS